MKTTSIIIDDVFDSKSITSILDFVDDSSSITKWYDLKDGHVHHDLCLGLLDIANCHYDLSSCIGYEFWTRLSTCVEGWHYDKDERLSKDKKVVSFPLCSIVYYPYVKNLKGGRLLLEDDIITPKSNRLVIFAPGIYHNVEEFTGERIAILLNPWDKNVSNC
tara:strand:- start:649 stop:1134 length:486 start_codon:yes stop_codon:yes gene_type:complete